MMLSLPVWALAASLSACAADPPVAGLRVLVKTAQPEASAQLVVQQAQAAAGVAVHYQAAMSPRWHALRLDCANASACEAALRSLAADRLHFEVVERDELRRPQP